MKIFLAGYYGFGNFGDELLLETVLDHLRHQKNIPEIKILHAPPGHVNRWSPSAVVRAIFNCDELVFGGGGIFQAQSGILSFWYYWTILFLGLLFGKKVVLAGQGVGPLYCPIQKFFLARAINRAETVSVRDQESLKLLQTLGVQKPIKLTSDLSFAYVHRPKSNKTERNRAILIPQSLKTSKKINADSFWGDASGQFGRFCETHGLEPALLPLFPAEDLALCEKIKARTVQNAQILSWKNVEDVFDHLNDSGIILSTRLHGALASILCGKPFLAIAGNPKIEHVLSGIKPLSTQSILKAESAADGGLLNKLNSIWSLREELAQAVRSCLPILRAQALESLDSIATN